MNRNHLFGAMFVGIACVAQAGGPLSTHRGVPVRYTMASPITFKTDLGSMGSFTNTTATNISVSSFQVWEDVAGATVAFTNGGQLPIDVDGSNYPTYLDIFDDGINPIIFDHDGSIIDALIGSGAHNRVIGFAGSAYNMADPNPTPYVEGQAVMNGTMAGTIFTEAQFQATFIHEFGHFIGLDHSQINAPFVGNGITGDDMYIPTMYPTSTDDDVALASLNPDDIAAVCNLYPVPSFAVSSATIAGSIVRFDATVVRGANVVAIKTTDSLMYQVSSVSDYLVQNNGNYTIAGLDSGSYWVKIEPIKTSFTGGSSVGPYASNGSDISFQNPVFFEYYNGTNESDDPVVDTALSRTALTVDVASVATANFVANREAGAPATSIIQYHGAPQFVFKLPSEYNDLKYAVRFTPGANAALTKVDFRLNGAPNAITGSGSLKVTVHQNAAGSVGGVPGTQIGGSVSRSFTTFTAGTINEVDLTSLAVTVTKDVSFHIAFEVVGTLGDTLQIIGDNGSTETNRSSSYYDAGSGAQWYNFIDVANWGTGYNLAISAHISIPTGAGNQEVTLLPDGFELQSNYPNPFNPTTNIPFKLSGRSKVTLTVYDLLGRLVRTLLADEERAAGDHAVRFDANGLPSGTYVAVLSVNGLRRMTRMVLVK